MNYEEFKSALQEEIQANFLQHIDFVSNTVNKTNMTLDALTLRFAGQDTACTIYPEQMYNDYKNGVSMSVSEHFDRNPEIPEITPEDSTDADGKTITGRDGKPAKDQTEKVLMDFKIVNVFDISQTDGEPLPKIAHKLDGTVNEYIDFLDALKQFSPVSIDFKKIEGSANGYYHLADKNIVINDGMSQAMNCKTAIHEITHALLHDRDNGSEKDHLPDRQTKEVQALCSCF